MAEVHGPRAGSTVHGLEEVGQQSMVWGRAGSTVHGQMGWVNSTSGSRIWSRGPRKFL